MLARRNDFPLISNDQGVAVMFENDWLKAALDRAACKAGYAGWWLLDEFSTTISQYLRQNYLPRVIELPCLERVVRTTLRDIGYEEIAMRFRAVNPFQCMSLMACLKTSGGKQEEAFFRRLTERIETLHAARVQHFHFYDLQPCAIRLVDGNSFSLWRNDSLMRAQIVNFVRARVQALAWQRKMQCTIR